MYLKRLLAFLCCFAFVFCLFPSSAFATGGNGNIDGGGGSMGHGTSSNFWNSGNDGVRITVVDASSGTAVYGRQIHREVSVCTQAIFHSDRHTILFHLD